MEGIGAKKNRFGSGWHYLVIFIVISVVLLTLWVREGDNGVLHSVRNGSAVITKPLAQVGSVLATPFRALGAVVTNATASQEDLLTLQAQNEVLSATVMQLEEYRQESERLAALLEIKDAYNAQGTAANVIGRSTDSWNHVITVNKGSSENIRPGMPVMNASGLIGQVEAVSLNSSTVRLITDEQSGVAAMIQSSRVDGILEGSVNGLLYLRYIPKNQEVQVGDVVITSGIGGIYPKGIAIGTIVNISGNPDDLYHTLVVSPLTSAEYQEEVLILTGNEKELTFSEPTTSEDGAR